MSFIFASPYGSSVTDLPRQKFARIEVWNNPMIAWPPQEREQKGNFAWCLCGQASIYDSRVIGLGWVCAAYYQRIYGLACVDRCRF